MGDADSAVGQLAAQARRGSIVAAAGCGKTEQIARGVAFGSGRRLILTHTHAGIDAITRRLKAHNVAPDKFRVDTIAGWALRFVIAFPTRSGLQLTEPRNGEDWNSVYHAAAKLVESGTVARILEASYAGVFVDEYQDCTRQQHTVIEQLCNYLPCCVFGDPLQAIFDFGGQEPVDWNNDVFRTFPKLGELTTPWRWKKAKNEELAEWLTSARRTLECGESIDFAGRPKCVSWTPLPTDRREHHAAIVKQCLTAMGSSSTGYLIVIGDAANINHRTELAKRLSSKGFSNIEPVSCKELYRAAKAIDEATGTQRFMAILSFVSECMTGTDKAGFEKAVDARQHGRKLGQTKFGDLFSITDKIIEIGSDEHTLAFLAAMHQRADTHLYRKEMFFAMRSALQIKLARKHHRLIDAIWEVQNRIRHAGRKFSKRSVGSTLLVKGLEFDHAVIVQASSMTPKDWYVALTRATRSIRIVSPQARTG